MKPGLLLAGLAAVAVAASGAASAAPAKKRAAPAARTAPAAKDWTKIVVATSEGGFRMGNPLAPLKLVEYGSFTCSHCATFAGEGAPQLIQNYVKTGRVSFEYRTFVRDPFDVAAALVARCAAPANFFRLSHDIFAAHGQWVARLQAVGPDEVKAMNALAVPERIARLASIGGFDAMAAKAGVPAAKVRQCLGDEKAMNQLVTMTQIATNKMGLRGTPSFLLNGKLTDAHSWAALEPLLKLPGG